MTNHEIIIVEQSITPLEQEVLPGDIYLTNLIDNILPEHIVSGKMLLQDTILLSLPADIRSESADLYMSECLSFGDVNNMVLNVHGAAIFEFPGGVGKDGLSHERYFQVRILVELEGYYRVIKSSSAPLLRHIVYMCRQNGWFLFKEPIEYKFIWRGAGKPHILDRVRKSITRNNGEVL